MEKDNSRYKWSSLTIKERLAITTALIAFSLGWILTGLACFVPLLLSEQSILWILGQSLLYASGVFGVTAYFSAESQRMRNDVRMMIHEHEKIEAEEEP